MGKGCWIRGRPLRLLDTYASKIAKICDLKTFWPLRGHLGVRPPRCPLNSANFNQLSWKTQRGFWKDGLLAESQARMSRGCRFLLFCKHKCLVTLIETPISIAVWRSFSLTFMFQPKKPLFSTLTVSVSITLLSWHKYDVTWPVTWQFCPYFDHIKTMWTHIQYWLTAVKAELTHFCQFWFMFMHLFK